MNHDHEFMNERMNERNQSQVFVSGESTKTKGPQNPLAARHRFSGINPSHLKAIAGQELYQSDGGFRVAPPSQRLRILDEYLRDAVQAGWATLDDRAEVLALIHHAAHRHGVHNRSAWAFSAWKNRHEPGKTMQELLGRQDRQYANNLLSDL